MSLLKYALPALAAAGVAHAQCSASATRTIQNAGDATQLAGCRTFSGSIAIATGTTGTISLDGIEVLDGNLESLNVSGLNSLGSSTIETITGEFIIRENQGLSNLNFPRLTEVGTIRWLTIPELRELRFDEELKTAETVDIQDTQLLNLDGINLEEVGTFYIANNRFIKKMELQLSNVTTALTIEGGGADLEVILPNLQSAANLTFRNVFRVETPSLEFVEGSIGFFESSFESYAAPNLTDVGQSLSFSDNGELNNLTLPELVSVGGGFLISKNPKLDKIDGINKLETVGGALDYSGDFSDVQLPALNDVQGAFNIQSTKDIGETCGRFEPLSGNEIQGEYTCESQDDDPTDVDGNSSSDADAEDEPDAAVSTRASLTIVIGISGALAVMLGLF